MPRSQTTTARAVAARQAAVAQERVANLLYGLGHTPKSLEETQREVLWWVYARAQAAASLRAGMFRGWGIAWTSAGYAELVPVEVPRPGRRRVTVEVLASAVSPGTERAQYLRLPNAQVGLLGRPGYSAAGRVHSVGRDVTSVKPGQIVAVTGAAHASVVTVGQEQVFPVPHGVDVAQASLVMLGMICAHGAALAAAEAGERVAVIGTGPIGMIAFRMAALTAVPVAAVARSRRGERLAAASDVPLLTVDEQGEAIRSLATDVVIEATGDPRAIGTAVAAARPGGRVVLLGSPRGITPDFPVSEIRSKRVQLIGAHVDTLDMKSAVSGRDERRAAAERFYARLADGSLSVADLIGPAVDPRRASAFYRDLAHSGSGSPYFDWQRLEQGQGIRRGSVLVPPRVTGRGMESKLPLRPRPGRGGSPFELGDPFAGASGRLRLGMIGCGDIAIHNAAGASAAPNVEVAVCFDPVTRLAEDLASRHGARVARSQEELLKSPDVDAVLLCVPHHLHAPLAIAACEAGKNVIVEKPLASDLASALAMAEAAHRHGVWVSTCFPQRYEPKVQIARRLIEAGALGDLEGTLVRLFLDKSPAYWLGGFSGRAHSDWRSDRNRAGGGVLIMNLSHHLDLLRYLGEVEVESVGTTAQPVDEVEDTIAAHLNYENGAIGSLLGSSDVRGSTEQEFSLWGSEGRIILDPQPRVYTMRPISGLRTTRWHSFGRPAPAAIRAVYLSRVATAIGEGRPPEVSLEDGIAVQAIIEAMYRSAETDMPVRPRQLITDDQPLVGTR